MAAKWRHEKLGSFTYRDDWTRTITCRAFNAFAYAGWFGHHRLPDGRYELSFGADDEKDCPSPAMVAVALKTLADPAATVTVVLTAIWEDIIGHGPDSGTWWHGNLDGVRNRIRSQAYPPKKAQEARLDGPSDLAPWLRLRCIVICKARKAVATAVNPATGKKIKLDRVYPAHPPIAELDFFAPFEEEHGLGVITDGLTVFGIGYSADVDLFLPRR